MLAFATHQNRILVTSDFRTMPRHFGNFLDANGQSVGVFLVKQRAPLAEVIEEALVLVCSASDADEWKNRIVEIPPPSPRTTAFAVASAAASSNPHGV